MFNRITSITPAYSGDVVCGTKDPHKYDAYVQYCADIDQRIDELICIKGEIQDTIRKVDDAKLRTLLVARYINFNSFESIAVSMGYDWRWIMRLHSRALTEVEKIISNN